MSDAILVFDDDTAYPEWDSVRRFLQMLGAAYGQLEAPLADYRDWVGAPTPSNKALCRNRGHDSPSSGAPAV